MKDRETIQEMLDRRERELREELATEQAIIAAIQAELDDVLRLQAAQKTK